MDLEERQFYSVISRTSLPNLRVQSEEQTLRLDLSTGMLAERHCSKSTTMEVPGGASVKVRPGFLRCAKLRCRSTTVCHRRFYRPQDGDIELLDTQMLPKETQ